MMTKEEALSLLTPAEKHVIYVLSQTGGSSKEASYRIGVSRHTIRNHRANINIKLGTSSITEVWSLLGYLRVPYTERQKYDRHT